MRALRSSARSSSCSLTDATFPSRDTRTALNSRAGIPYRVRYALFNDLPDRPAATSANSFRCTRL